MTCECYRAEKNFLGKIGVCWGTRERDACSCGGDKSKCDFYPTIHSDEKKPPTNYAKLRAMNMNQMALWLAAMLGSNPFDGTGDDYRKWLNWLEQEATE